jgi:sRNA-binding protein
MVVGAQRVDLTGAEVAEVTAEDEKHAKAKLDEYKQRRKERHQEARKQQRVAQKEERLSSKLDALVKKF